MQTVFSEYRYNTSISNPCLNSPCTHLCLLIPGGYRCACPDTTIQVQTGNEVSCDTTQERPRPSPQRCPCQNRGTCTGDGQIQCLCPNDYEGVHCELQVQRVRTPSESIPPATIIVPILLILLAGLAGAGVYVYFFRRSGRAKGSGFTGFGTSPSVSFRQGTNVEFGPAAFSGNGSSAASTMVYFSSSFVSYPVLCFNIERFL